MEIKGVGIGGLPPAGLGRAGGGSAFAVPSGGGPAPAQAAAAAAGLDALLALQEWDGAPARDRRARQHGRAMLDALARLQLALLGGGADGAALAELAALVEGSPQAADPGLAEALAAIGLRARIELARREPVSGLPQR